MQLLRLTLSRFRNLTEVSLAPSPHATIAVGQNGQGKTNLLEAIYFLATLKPLRATRLSELVQFDQPIARVQGRFLLRGAERDIGVEITPSSRQAFVDGKKAANLEEYFGGVSVVAFTPDDLRVIKGGPDARRLFLDRAVFNRFPGYLRESRDYARALKSRNRLLKERAEAPYLEAYDETLARVGARLWVRRRALMEELSPRAARAFAAVGRTEVPADYGYAPAHFSGTFASADESELERWLKEALSTRLGRDRERGFTSVGPHADDVRVQLGEHPARSFASQGQQRALVLAWKMAEIENLEATRGDLPLLLLDDASSELDPERNAFLMAYLAQSGAQVFLTTTDASLVRPAAQADALWYSVQSGHVAPT